MPSTDSCCTETRGDMEYREARDLGARNCKGCHHLQMHWPFDTILGSSISNGWLIHGNYLWLLLSLPEASGSPWCE